MIWLLPLLTECSREKEPASNVADIDEVEETCLQFGENLLEKDESWQKERTLTVRLFIRSVFSNPYFVSLQKHQTGYLMVAKKMLGKGGYKWGGELLRLTKRVPLDVGDQLWDKLQHHEILKPWSEYELAVMTGATDSDTWIIEVYDGTRMQRMIFRDPRALGDHAFDQRLRNPGPYMEFKEALLSMVKVDLELPEAVNN